ncbi:MAG: GerMN domain-containing protein [Candidatus Limnocylindria bacterium]
MTAQPVAPLHRRRSILGLAIAALVVASACTTSGGLGTVPPPPATPTPAPSQPGGPDLAPAPSVPVAPSPSDGPTASPSGPAASPTPVETIIVRTYGVLPGEVGVEGLVPTLQVIPATTGVARAAIEQLLAGRLADGVSSSIPAGTRLLGLSIKDRVATIDLSKEFETGGGSASSFYRLGQVVYTLTQFSTVGSVLFQVDGRTVTTFGPEGIVLDGPQARADYEDLLPAIFVDRPAYGAAIGNPARITGNANVFEATLQVTILDGSGRVVYEDFATATCGTGCRGTFDVTAGYSVAKAQWGTLRVWVASARDGLPENVRDYPVWLTPAS